MRMADSAGVEAQDDVDPDIRRFVDALNHGYGQFSDFDTLPLPERRKAAEQVRANWRQGGPVMANTTEVRIEGVRARIHHPTGQGALPAMIYVHGGGWTMFSIDTHDRLMREYAARARIAVVGIDYSLSPEAKFPKALDEIVAAFHWVEAEGAAHGIDSTRVAIGGDSAGGNLAVAASLSLRAKNGAMPSALLLNYGAFGPEHLSSYALYGGPRYMLTVEEMDRFWANYTRYPAELDDPLVSPVLGDLRGIPPVFMAIAECDILAEVNRVMARRFEAAGVNVEAHIYRGATHSFLEAVSISPLADRAIQDSSDWLSRTLRG